MPEIHHQPGDLLAGQYEVRFVKEGGMGVVYLCYDRELHEPFAIKTFQDKYFTDHNARDRFMKEALTWVKLERHPNIVQCLFVRNIDDKPHIIMEYVVGPEGYGADLRSWLQHGPLAVGQVLDFAIQICLGMWHAHEKVPGLVHRDIKPGNILITRDKTAKVTDFGLVKTCDAGREMMPAETSKDAADHNRASLTTVGGLVGTPQYMSPEQCRGEPVDVRSDIYSFGCVLYEMLTGRLVYEATSTGEYLFCHVNEEPSPIRQHVPSLSTEMDQAVLRCLEKPVEERYQDFGQLLETLVSLSERLTGKKPKLDMSSPALRAWELSNKGLSLWILNQHDDAIASLDQAIGIDSKYAMAWLHKGVVLGDVGQSQEALACFEQALEIDSKLASAWVSMGSTLSALNQKPEAVACYNQALEIEPENVVAWLNKGIALSDLGQHEEAIACYDQILVTSFTGPGLAEVWNSKGTALYGLGRFEEAIDSYDHALEIDSGEAHVWVNKGEALCASGKHQAGVACCDQALRIIPTYAAAWNCKANALDEVGQHGEAIICFDQALEIEPENAATWNNKGRALFASGQHKKALICFEHALQIDPQLAQTWSNKGAVLHILGQSEKAISCYRQALVLDPQNADAWLNAGLALQTLGQHRESMVCYDRVLGIQRGHAQAWCWKGVSLSALGQHQEAIACFAQAVDVDPGLTVAWGAMGAALAISGSVAEGLACLEKALQLDPGNPQYHQGVQACRQMLEGQ